MCMAATGATCEQGVLVNLVDGTSNAHQITGPTSNGRAPKGFWFIYFYGTEDGGEVKVGKTRQSIFQRRQQHQNQNGHDLPMRTLAVVLGQAADESAIKRHFRPCLSRTRSDEWFKAGEDMRAYLRWLRSQSFVARTETEMHALVPVDSSAWLPGGDRAKTPMQLRIAEADAWDDLGVDHFMEGDFYTPRHIVEAARRAMGTIDLDPASCREANEVVGATRYFGFHDNGLLQEWAGNVWANPPYGAWDEWVPKILEEWRSGRITQLCVIAPTRTLTAKTFHPLVAASSAVTILCGRVSFWGPKSSGSPDDGHAVFYLGDHTVSFSDAFRGLGTTFYGNRQAA